MYAPHTQFFGYMNLNARGGLRYVLTGNSVVTVEFHEKMKIGADFILFYGFSYVYRKALFEAARFDDIDLSEDESFIRRIVEAGRKVLAADDTQASCLHLIDPASTSRRFFAILDAGVHADEDVSGAELSSRIMCFIVYIGAHGKHDEHR